MAVPIITIVDYDPLQPRQHLLNTPYQDAGATANDTEEGDLTSTIIRSGATDDDITYGDLGDTFSITYTVTDHSGHIVSATRSIILVVVERTNKPVITATDVWANNPVDVSDVVGPDDMHLEEGWRWGEKPFHAFANFMQNRNDSFIVNVNQNGVPEWDNATVYNLSALTMHNEILYHSIQYDPANLGNQNHTPGDALDPGWWKIGAGWEIGGIAYNPLIAYTLGDTVTKLGPVPGAPDEYRTYTYTNKLLPSVVGSWVVTDWNDLEAGGEDDSWLPKTAKPILSTVGSITALDEGTDIIITIDNYNAGFTYTITTANGTWARAGANITFTADTIPGSETYIIGSVTVTAEDTVNTLVVSAPATFSLQIMNQITTAVVLSGLSDVNALEYITITIDNYNVTDAYTAKGIKGTINGTTDPATTPVTATFEFLGGGDVIGVDAGRVTVEVTPGNGYPAASTSHDITVYSIALNNTITEGDYDTGVINNIVSVDFTADGTLMYISGDNEIAQYSLAIPFDFLDVSNVSLVDTFTPGDIVVTNGGDLVMSGPGDKIFLIDEASNTINQYDTASPYNFAGANTANDGTFGLFADAAGLAFTPDGKEMFIGSSNGTGGLHNWTLGTAWDVTSATSLVSKDLTIDGVTDPVGVAFNDSGLIMFITGKNGSVHSYTLTTAYDISTATYKDFKDITSISGITAPRGVFYNDRKLVIGDYDNTVPATITQGIVYQYNIIAS